MNFLRKLFDTSKKDVEMINPIVSKINSLEEDVAKRTDEELRDLARGFREAAGLPYGRQG